MSWADVVANLRLDLALQLAVAVILGAAVGLERHVHGKPAGVRTNTLICVGACLFTQVSVHAAAAADPTRIAAQIVTGVGFIGAGTIMRGKGSVSGLTTAATIWVVAAIGMVVGVGWIMEAAGATLLLLLVLRLLGGIERVVERRSGSSRLALRIRNDPEYLTQLEEIVGGTGARLENLETTVDADQMLVQFRIRGTRHVRDQAKLRVLRATGAWGVTDLDRTESEGGRGELKD